MAIREQLRTWSRKPEATGKMKREKDLAEIFRFSQYPDVIHRNNLLTHSQRVSIVAGTFAELLTAKGVKIDTDKTRRLGLYHDDPELVTGDIPTPIKQGMTETELKRLRKEEDRAAKKLARKYFGRRLTFGDHEHPRTVYLADYTDVSHKISDEAHVVNLADKVEGVSETMNNIRCGYDQFDNVLERYQHIFAGLAQTNPHWDTLNTDPAFPLELDQIPTPQALRSLPQISPRRFTEDPDTFWGEVFHPSLPNFYSLWMRISLTQFRDPVLFPGWEGHVVAKSKPSLRNLG